MTNGRLETARIPPSNINLGNNDRLTSWCTWHLNEDDSDEFTELNKDQCGQLMADYEVKLNELIQTAVFNLLGRIPTDEEVTEKIEEVIIDGKPDQQWWFWGCECVLLTIKPKSRITETKDNSGGRYFLWWYYKDVANLNRN